MTPMEILSKIVEAEVNAKAVFEEAVTLKDGFDNYVNEQIETLRKQYFDSAEKEIAEAAKREKARADTEISELDEKFQKELSALKTLFENEREEVVEKIFGLAVAADA